MTNTDTRLQSTKSIRAQIEIYDCIVVGAGAAGLACARELVDANKSVLILEGRGRTGGRIFTARDLATSVPIELGAEFIHGAPMVTLARLNSAGLSFYDLTDKHLQLRGRELVPMDVFDKVIGAIGTLDANRKKDRTLDEALKSKRLEAGIEKSLRSYVEGFHAADTRIIGERALAQAESGGTHLNGSESFRIVEGYDRFIASFLHGIDSEKDRVRLNTVVKKITWRKSAVSVQAVSSAGFGLETFQAKAVVVSVPLGVLKAPSQSKAAIEFAPHPPQLTAALSGLHMGHALRLNLRFSTRFWEEGRREPIGYLHAGADRDFPTWWTQMPLRSPILTAWQGGPRVEKLAKLNEAERLQTALNTLSDLLGVAIEKLQRELVTWYFHDWSNDPFSLGAYSYVGLDGDRKGAPLAKPFGNSLFFAGEATHAHAERGTVDGAVETGLRAAKQVLRALGGK